MRDGESRCCGAGEAPEGELDVFAMFVGEACEAGADLVCGLLAHLPGVFLRVLHEVIVVGGAGACRRSEGPAPSRKLHDQARNQHRIHSR